MNKTGTKPKTNWNQMQTGAWLNPSNLHGALSTTIMQGAWGRASTGDGSKWRWSNGWGEWSWSNNGWGELICIEVF
jgi:hypothetical protein